MNSNKIHINEDLCTGCGTCSAIAPGCFNLNDDFKAEVLENGSCDEESVQMAEESCPSGAIEITK
ncbi:MAG: ferredoxin [Candidatus Magasanikbacteria bacterium CG_4_10_14_0_2_um_filter_33_14]|uniref:Ferredoxin n=1 Tax=Candidatus Magasanikbacteria bacterium CG_4_10_14_0_2_um_filter_33_14 TaxID=1974636 RepID=A0A2M7VA17_9BACT|nr:MAG: ferredoxin [Candidatus Magasanikbacteria bacterium CG_4_10_14_0_2_um_filter_33_14]